MKTKTDTKGKRTHHMFSRDQVLSAELHEFLTVNEPAGLGPEQLRGLFGRLSLELEDAIKCGDLATISEARTLVRKLHGASPWAGFLLDLERPLGSSKTVGALPILAYALCVVDLQWAAWESTGRCELHLDEDQVRKFRTECFRAIDILGKRAKIPPNVLAGRKDAIGRQLNRLL